MKRAPIVCLPILLLVPSLLGAQSPPGERVVPPDAAARHQGEIEAKQAQMDRAIDLGISTLKGWAPTPEPSPIDVLHYDLDLFLDVGQRRMSGTAVIELAAVEDGLAVVELDVDLGLRVMAVVALADETYPSDSPRPLQFEHAEDRLSVTLTRSLAAGETVKLMIPYGGRGGRFGQGINWSSHAGGIPSIFTFAEPFGARVWFPCNDRPDDKATVDLTVTARSDLVVASNGLEIDHVDNGDGTATTRWSSQYQVATYLVVMNLSDYAYREWTYDTMDGSTMPVVAYMYPETADAGEVDLAITPEMIEVLASRFDEYPFVEEKYGNLTANFGGGMEHQTLTTIGVFFGNPWMEWLNVHELGHQWWGDWVTCDDWRELWLNEGFATFSEFVWAEEHHGDDFLLQYAADADENQFFKGPLYDNPVAFSRTIYDKGALVVRMLRFVVGDDAFFDGIRTYRDEFAQNSATTEGLRSVMEEASGMDLGWFFDQWVYGANRPRFQYEWEAVSGPAIRLTVTQKHSNAPLFRTPMEVHVTTNSGTEEHQIWIEAETQQTIDVPVSSTPTAVELDPDRFIVAHLSRASEPDIDFGPDFPDLLAGQVYAGQTATITVPITNTGGSPLEVSGIGMASGTSFHLTSPTDYPLSLAPGESVDLVIEFSSASAGRQTDWIGVFSNDPSYEDGMALLFVEGRGARFEDPTLVAPSSANAGVVPTGGFGETTVLIRNFGAAALSLSTAIQGDGFTLGSVIPPMLQAGESTTVYLRFHPETDGEYIGTLTLVTNDPDAPQHVVTLSGVGSGAPRIDVTPAPIGFGVTSAAGLVPVGFANSGTEDLVISGLTIDEPFVFADPPPNLPMTIAAGSSEVLVAGIDTLSTGDLRGNLRVTSNDPSLPRAVIPVSAHLPASGLVENWSVPAAASAPGLGGAQWNSRAFLLNPTDQDMVIDLGFRPGSPRSLADLSLSLPARSQRAVTDLVAATGHTGVGGIAIRASGPEFVGVTRTFSSEDAGTYGQYIPALGDHETQLGGQTYLLGGLAGNEGFHTNFGVLNLGDSQLRLTYSLFRADGVSLGQGTLTAQARAYRQVNEIFSGVTQAAVRGGFLMVTTDDSSARFAAFGSVVDDGSHDPTLVLPVAVTDTTPITRIIPVVASNAGANQTMWRSDVSVVNFGDSPAQVEVTLHLEGSTLTHSVSLPARSASHLEDIVQRVFGSTGSGWLEISGSRPNVHAFSRTFNDDHDGTYGQNVPAVTATDLTRSGETVVLAGLSSAEGFRTNLGITSLADVDTMITVRVFDDGGELIGELPVAVGAGRFVQVQRLLEQQLNYTGTAWATLHSADSGARYVAHASIVDGDSGDPVYLPAAPRSVMQGNN